MKSLRSEVTGALYNLNEALERDVKRRDEELKTAYEKIGELRREVDFLIRENRRLGGNRQFSMRTTE